MTLNKLRNKRHLKKLNETELASLAQDIREFLIGSISETGGHLASNLGVVELTLALHRVFDTPADSIVWDVGHQSYVHKILTGRRKDFGSLRKQSGLSGFPKTKESKHDAFDTGHSSTAISAALGLATARDLKGEKNKVIAVVGDGSITGGLAYEGLNNAGRANTDVLVVLNDNQMSISKNVGAISKHLNQIRTTGGYLHAKKDVRNILDKLPFIGKVLSKGIEKTKDIIKYAVIPGVLFEELGFKYLGPIDGHDTLKMAQVFEETKKIKGPVLVHVLTKKGKGYHIAERAPQNFHGVGSFNVITGNPNAKTNGDRFTDIFSKEIIKHAEKDSKVVAVTAAMSDGTGLSDFRKQFPRRLFDVGIAEGHAVTFAAGLAKAGLKPVVSIYSSFLQRAYDNVLHDVAIQNLPVIFILDRAGAVAAEGETHQGLYDFAYLSHIPNLTIAAPANKADFEDLFNFAVKSNAPTAIRYPNDIAPSGDIPPTEICNGSDIAIVSTGVMLNTATEVVAILKQLGFEPGQYHARFVKPLDKNLTNSLQKYKYVFTIEDAAAIGGLGSLLNATHSFAFPDKFLEPATRDELFQIHGLDANSIAQKIHIYCLERDI